MNNLFLSMQGLSVKKASKQFKIPRSTIHKLKNKHTSAVGRATTFTKQEEKLFKIRTVLLRDWGFPLDSPDLGMMVVSYLQKQRGIVRKFNNHIHVKKLGHTSEFLFGVY